jgi:hypothetical protein
LKDEKGKKGGEMRKGFEERLTGKSFQLML